MHLSSTLFSCLLFSLVPTSSAYFVITQPALGAQFTNNIANAVLWEKGVLDGINQFDVELARMNENGLSLVARNVPTKPGKFNLLLMDVPPGDDYFLLFLNSTHGVMHVTSSRFAVLASGSSPTGTLQAAPGAATITFSGAPNPTKDFATTFPALANGAVRLSGLKDVQGGELLLMGLVSLMGWVVGVVWTLGW